MSSADLLREEKHTEAHSLALGLLDLVFTKHEQARNIVTKPQRKDIGVLPADCIHAIQRKFVSNRIYGVACLVQMK